jgi:anti-sigma regulatory factor (Ser/Thr protein kinase)
MTGAGRSAGGDDEALHSLLLYDSEDSLRAGAVPYLREGLDRGESVVVMVSRRVEPILVAALGADAERVEWQAADVSYRRLGAMFEGFRQFLADHRAAGAAMRLIGEDGVGGGPDRMAAYLRFEAMANEVYRPYGYPWACLYNIRAHAAETLRRVRQVHPQLLEPGGRTIRNTDYLDPRDYLAQGAPLPRPPAAVQLDAEVTDTDQLVPLRRLLRRWAESQRLTGEDRDAVLIAVNEAVANALEHGAPPVHVRAWTSDGLARVQVHDRGARPIPPTAGYHRPSSHLGRGFGLWVVRYLTDAVITHTDSTGTTVALDFPLVPGQ